MSGLWHSRLQHCTPLHAQPRLFIAQIRLPPPTPHPHPSCCRDELLSYDPYDEGTFCRSRFWLLMAYAISLGAIGGSVLVMLHKGGDASGIAQVACILGAALVLFTSRSEGEGGGSSYDAF